MGDLFFTVFRCSSIERCIEICEVLQENRLKCYFFLLFKMTPASVMKRLKANRASLVSDFHRASLELAWLCLCRVTNESTEIENCYSSLNRELRWLWNPVYLISVYYRD